MVWAAFWGRKTANLIRITGDPNTKRGGNTAISYLDVLEENIETIQKPGLLFMQDNAPIYTAKAIRKWLEDTGIDVLKQPPYSPGLNLIEHLWFRLKKLVYQMNPGIDQKGGSADTVRDKLWEALERAQHIIDEDILKDLVKSMPRRAKACINAEGWYTKY